MSGLDRIVNAGSKIAETVKQTGKSILTGAMLLAASTKGVEAKPAVSDPSAAAAIHQNILGQHIVEQSKAAHQEAARAEGNELAAKPLEYTKISAPEGKLVADATLEQVRRTVGLDGSFIPNHGPTVGINTKAAHDGILDAIEMKYPAIFLANLAAAKERFDKGLF